MAASPSEKRVSITPVATFITTIVPPPGPNNGEPLALPTRTIPFPTTNSTLFNEALAVRLEVFVDEQKCAAELEIDDDDSRSWQWVVHDKTPEGKAAPAQIPVAVVRLVPPPHVSHEDAVAAFAPGGNGMVSEGPDGAAKFELDNEPYIKFGRVAVLPDYRGCGLARRLMETAMEWAAENPDEISRAYAEVYKREGGSGEAPEWKGLTLVHAQTQVEKLYGRLGYVTDEKLGRWVEEGIEHIGMWKRLDIKA
ncbi:acyl-CoA N-acyltransferase [Aspergillus californicus]